MNNKAQFIRLQLGSFISQCGSHFLTLALSAFIVSETGSLILGSAIFVASYLPSVLVSARLGGWIDRTLSKRNLIANELIAIVVSILCGVALNYSVSLLLLFLSIRSVLLFSSRTMNAKWIKLISPPELQASRIKLSFLFFFLATALSGLGAAAVLGLKSFWIIVGIDVLTYLLGIAVYTTLSGISSGAKGADVQEPNVSHALSIIWSKKELLKPFLTVIVSQSLFQGAYTVLVNYLPIQLFKLGASGTGYFQIAASVGIILAFMVLWKAPELFSHVRGLWTLLWLGGGISIAGAIGLSVQNSLIAFFILNFFYELLWLDASSNYFKNIPKERVGELQFTLTAFASFCMAGFTLIGALLIGRGLS